jgi:NADPH:quinone reductase-like Zn-dependent oxidoreductase
MKAIVHRTYGGPEVLTCEEVETPAPRDNEVLLKVCAASVNPVDRLFRGEPYLLRMITGLGKPKDIRFGRDVAGHVEAVGKDVTQFKAGDEVFGTCLGACAEYACATESALVMKPANVTFEQAAAVPVAGLTALQGLRDKGEIRAGQKVLINGATGGVGTFAVQVAKALGADVTGVCSTRKVEMVRSLGADRVIDYTQEDFTQGSQRYDLIFDLVANHSLSECRQVLNPNGICVIAGAKTLTVLMARTMAAPLLSRQAKQKFIVFIAKLKKKDLAVLSDLMTTGKVKPVIDQRYRLSETADAIRYLEQGHARGKIVITVE